MSDGIVNQILQNEVIVKTPCIVSDGCKVLVSLTEKPSSEIAFCMLAFKHDFTIPTCIWAWWFLEAFVFLAKLVTALASRAAKLIFRFGCFTIIVYERTVDATTRLGSCVYFPQSGCKQFMHNEHCDHSLSSVLHLGQFESFLTT